MLYSSKSFLAIVSIKCHKWTPNLLMTDLSIFFSFTRDLWKQVTFFILLVVHLWFYSSLTTPTTVLTDNSNKLVGKLIYQSTYQLAQELSKYMNLIHCSWSSTCLVFMYFIFSETYRRVTFTDCTGTDYSKCFTKF